MDQEPSSKTEPTAEQPPSPWVPVDPAGHPDNNHGPDEVSAGAPPAAFTEPERFPTDGYDPVEGAPDDAHPAPGRESPYAPGEDVEARGESTVTPSERPPVHPVFPLAVPPGSEAPEPLPDVPEQREPAPEPEQEASPNWMLAFVCAWAGSFAVYQAWDVTRRTDLTRALHNLALGGYTSLGIGLFLCALEALLWGKLRRRGATQLMLLLVPLVLIFIGVLCLILFKDPDPTRSKI